MTLAISATFDDDTGSVELTLTGATAVAGEWTVTRTDANGSATVRVYADLDLTNPTVISDYECALAGSLAYTATAGVETASTSLSVESTHAWLGFPIYPNYNIPLVLGSDFEKAYAPALTVHAPLDRDDPVVIDGRFGFAAGRLSILVDDDVEANAIVAAYRRVRTAHLRAGTRSVYHKARALGIAGAAARSAQCIVRGEYIEVARPIGDLVGSLGWTFGDTTALGVTFASVADVFPTFADRTAGPAS